MLWIILVSLGLIAVIVWVLSDKYLGIDFILASFFAAVLLAVMFNGAASGSSREEYQSKPHAIANLQDGSEIEGSFFLGIGGIGENMKYTFYGEDSPGIYELKTIDAEDAKVTFTDRDPYYTFTCYRDTTSVWLSVFSDDWCDDEDITFHVPEGSIKQQYKLDAK